ncbi:MAG: Rieske 2Fe-2S domain-containing protein [Caldilineaceae bacterium]|nr:Rieske 2Fe-2S domain-containing protein [Caldilineaceae bacterium]
MIGMIGFVQRAIAQALISDLHEVDPELEMAGVNAWNALMMVILEMLARNYSNEPDEESFAAMATINDEALHQLAVGSYEQESAIARSIQYKDVLVAKESEIPEGARKIVQVDAHSIGLFHHQGRWYALENSCLHRGGPVCTGKLDGNVLVCPWHGYEYDVTNGQLLFDPAAKLPVYPVTVRDGDLYLRIPVFVRDAPTVQLQTVVDTPSPSLGADEFRPAELPPGQIRRVSVEGEPVAVYNVEGAYYATHDECPHAFGPLSEGRLEGNQVICPWHDSCFDVTNGQVMCGPATEPIRTYAVTIEDGIGRVEASESPTAI